MDKSATGITCKPVTHLTGSSCSGCSALASCSSKPSASKTIKVELPVDLVRRRISPVLRAGQLVDVAVPGGMLLALSLVVYLPPVLLMLFFTVCGSLMFPVSEAQVAISAAVGLSLGVGVTLFVGPALRLHIIKHLTVRSSVDNPPAFEGHS